MTYTARITAMTVLPDGEPTFSELATTVAIDNDAAGEFVIVSQTRGKVSISPDEWPTLRAAIDKMIAECRPATGSEASE